MPDTAMLPEARVARATALLIDIRQGRHAPTPGLPAGLRPRDLKEAEAIQMGTYAAMGWRIAGWKVGRTGANFFAAPMPDAATAPMAEAPLQLPPGSGVELEVAIRLRQDLDAAALTAMRPGTLPEIADLVLLFEFVNNRFVAGTPPDELDKIADGVGNVGAAFSPPVGAWSWADIDTLSMRLLIDDVEVARHAGPHRHAPLFELVEAWRRRCLAMGHAPKAGEVVTFGSLTGVQKLPAAGCTLRGELAGRGSLVCHVAPLA
jgi:2-keto-4-pentenoate hydratase